MKSPGTPAPVDMAREERRKSNCQYCKEELEGIQSQKKAIEDQIDEYKMKIALLDIRLELIRMTELKAKQNLLIAEHGYSRT